MIRIKYLIAFLFLLCKKKSSYSLILYQTTTVKFCHFDVVKKIYLSKEYYSILVVTSLI
jgi:hypothetical protein